MNSVLITGASGALGQATARALLARGVPLLLACRSQHSADALGRSLASPLVRTLALDVSDLEAVRALRVGALGGLVCNAGLQIVSGVRRTERGVEQTFATNHLGHFLLARTLLPALQPGGRVVFVASNTHDPRRCTGMPAPDLGDLRALAAGEAFAHEAPELAGRRRYTSSKLCNVLCAYELARRTRQDVKVVAFDPGLMPGTGLAREYGPAASWAWRNVLPALGAILPNVNSAETSGERLARVVLGELEGDYISNGKLTRSSRQSYDAPLAGALWELSSELAGVASTL
jgi:NAD(P)-dependent dehydrogenase (short-subunit alcohol dehydrogenase family)